jgi:hypothetical protein
MSTRNFQPTMARGFFPAGGATQSRHWLRGLAPWALLMLAPAAWAQAGGSAQTPASPEGSDQRLLDLRLELGATADSNVTRSNRPGERLSDQSLSLQLGASRVLPTSEHTQFVLNAFAGLEQFRRFHGLGKVYAGGEAELQYRGSADFDAPTFGLAGSLVAEQHPSAQRDGLRLTLGANMRMALTDRVNLFAALGRNLRSARGAVFDTRDTSLRFNLDHALASNRTLYLGLEWRRGDIVSSGLPSALNQGLSRAYAPDDAFASAGYSSYRFAGRSALLSAGLNIALGATDALDVSWRAIRSEARLPAGAPYAGPRHYLVQQLSLAYLKTF